MLVSELRKQDFVETVSPEIYVFSVINNEPIMVRGVEPKPFLRIENAAFKETKFNDKFALIGEGLAKRFNLGINDTFVLTGSIVPAIMELPITGIYSTATPSNDELLIPLQTANILRGKQCVSNSN
jgi:ABC-type lipoprotein release transport system permease subunit